MKVNRKKITYQKSGVNYSHLDPVKIYAQKAGSLTAKNIENTQYREIFESRGESAYVMELPDRYLAFITEGLGTKNLIADAMRKITGKSYYDLIAFDTVISVVMDLITVGAKPLIVSAYWSIGDAKWLEDKERVHDLIKGWKKACDSVGVVWGGGETPILKDIVCPSTIDLAGAAFGEIKPKKRLVIGDQLSNGDSIIIFESSGIHVNGLTLARKLAEQLPEGYKTKLGNGKLYGEELLTPTVSYANLIQELFAENINIHYMVNITGHGWRKLMRGKKKFTYLIDKLPPVPVIFKFIQKKANLSAKEMYATFNMGAGLAVFAPEKDTDKIIKIALQNRIKAWKVGQVKNGSKKLLIKPLHLRYSEKELEIR